MEIYVRPGDTLWNYSQWFRIPFQLVLDSNPDLADGRLNVGDRVQIPGYLRANYTIRAGDTFWSIAKARGVPVEALLSMNPNVEPQNLQAGVVIRVPLRVTWRVAAGNRRYNTAALSEDTARLIEVYPFLRRREIGRSVMGKPIHELRIGGGAKRVHINASFHANEWITTPVLVTFINDYLLALTNGMPIRGLNVAPYYASATLSTVPMVNPDGVDLVVNGLPAQEPYRESVLEMNGGSRDFSGWKANIRGVDLNNQFPARWEDEAARGEKKPGPRDYSGTAPLTEPEAIAMAELTRQSDFARVLALHTQGRVIYWGYENMEPPAARTMAAEFARVSGYVPERTVESWAGYKDWFIQEWRRPGFTIEMGQGQNPLPLSQFNEIYQQGLGIFLASLYL
ncbi:M14 family metallopeptidase [Paenibacillus thermotolerans]|uniref:M14 family metallopeptidase n=1 Tax=Paenibacillus thermotolerans TaxID=3027807 RepID=UPI002368B588|nr:MULTISPECIES: M14 family metallopeptidase [unclassified Paenibacillus]